MKLCYHCMTQIKEEKLNKCPNCGKSLSPEPVSDRYLKPGTELQNKFIVGYPIGAGGFGNTYIGWNKLLLRRVAIKEFYPEQYITRAKDSVTVSVATETLLPRFRKGLQQFLGEARKLTTLQDIKGVVEISNFFVENGTGYIIMEYLEGMDVKTILKKSGNKKDYEWCRRVILTLLHTLREIHKRGVLHMDIAPDNIFVTREGIIKLIDFGAARHSTALANMKSEVILKVGYAPIEQYSREAPQGPYTDLYAVAALFYRMLTGQKPIPADERMNEDTLIMPSEMGVELPEQAEMAIMVCLNIQPQYRLQSADEFMEALDGKNFVPVYEPEWILPPVEEKSSFSNMPIAARIGIVLASIFVVLGVVFGGAYVAINGRQGNEKNLETDGYIMPSLVGLDKEEAEERLKNNKFNIEFNILHTYSSEKEELGKIADQSIPAGSFNPADYKDMTVNDSEVSGTMNILINTDEYITFMDIKDWGMSAYRLQQNLKLDSSKMNPQEEEDGTYWGITSISTTDGKEYTAADIQKDDSDENEEILIPIEDIKNINYSAKNFFYWEKLPDFKGKNIGECEETVYKLDMNNELTPDGNALLEQAKGLIREDYLTFDGSYAEGDIVEQAVVDEEFDGSKDMGKLEEGYLFRTIGYVFRYTDNSKECLEMLDAGYTDDDNKTFHFKNVSYVSGNGENELVDYVLVTKGGEKVDCFTKEEMPDIEVVIYTKAATTQAPQNPSPRPAPSNDPEILE